MEANAKPLPLCPVATKQAKDDLAIVTTLLLSPGNGTSSGKTFYAHFLMRMNVVFTNWVGGRPMDTLGVSITDKVNLYVNPDFFNKLNTIQKMEVVEHEIGHIIYKHPVRAKDYIGEGYNSNTHQLFNIASDAGINETLPNLMKFSEGFVTFDRLNAQLQKKGSKDRVGKENASEVTYDILKANQEQQDGQGGAGEGLGTVDDHGVWSESTDNREVAEAIIKDAANKAQAATGIGNMPDHMLREISAMNKASVNWQREMRQFATSALRYDHERTRTRRNRRTGLLNPGRRKKPKLRIAACADSSGSVGDEAFSQFFSEMIEISKMNIEIVVIDADSGVAAVYDFDPKVPFKRYGNGGTAYQPAITKAAELKVDAIMYFGDMDASDVPVDPGIPFLWAVVGGQNPPASFGRTIRVEVAGQNGRR